MKPFDIDMSHEVVTIDSQFIAQKDTGALPFQIVTYAKDGKLSVTSQVKNMLIRKPQV
jgi:hypothetical protein